MWQIEELDRLNNENSLDEVKKMERMKLLNQLKLLAIRKCILVQKVRCEWIGHKDTNSKIPNSSIRWRRMKNEIKTD